MIEWNGSFDGVAFFGPIFEMRVVSRVEMLVFDEEIDPALIDDPRIIFF